MPILFSTGNANGLGFNIGIGANGQLGVGFDVRSSGAYGNGAYGGYRSTDVGFNTATGAFAQGSQGNYSPMGGSNQSWGSDAWGSYNTNSSQDVFGNYANNSYASNVFGNYNSTSTSGNAFGYTNTQAAGNVWGGPQWQSQSGGSAFGPSYSVGGFVPQYGAQRYLGCGGGQVGNWFGRRF